MRYFISLLLVIVLGTCVRAQGSAFAVTASVQSLPPFTNTIDEWTDPVNNQLGVSLLLNDRRRPDYQVRLRVTIAGMGIRLTTRPEFVPRPIPLSFGAVEQLTSADLREYFDLNNLTLSGISRQQYFENGGLPDGTYSICVEAIDYARTGEGAVSRQACTFVRAALLDPPVINEPLNLQTLVSNSLLVQWDPRHAPLGSTNYEVLVYEMDAAQTGFSAEDIYSRTQPYWRGEIMGTTSFNFDPSFTPLEAGEYMMIVRAADMSDRPVYKNNGRSAPVFFTYGGDAGAAKCPPPVNVSADIGGSFEATVLFDANTEADWYTLNFREKRVGANWYTNDEIFPFTAPITNSLKDLKEGTTYEVQLNSVCGGVAGPGGDLYEFTTDRRTFNLDSIDCGDKIDSIPAITNRINIGTLNYGDIVKIGQFDLKLGATSSNGKGGWDGYGLVYVGWMANQWLKVDFKNLYINQNGVVYDGVAIAVDDGLKSLKGFVTVDSLETLAKETNKGLSFCGDSLVARTPATYDSTFYLADNPAAGSHFIDYDPDKPITVNPERFDSRYNPKNKERPYVADDYKNANNPYTPEKPYDKTNIWNPWNGFHAYDYLDYDDPANPWSAEYPWSIDMMFEKQGKANSITLAGDYGVGGTSLPYSLGKFPNTIAIFGVKFTPKAAFLNAYASFRMPNDDQFAAFQAVGIGFQPGGLQGEAQMKMLADLKYGIGKEMQLTFKKGSDTYVKFNCYGLTEVSVAAEMQLCRDLAVPINMTTGKLDSTQYVTGTMILSSPGWGEFTASVSISPFELKQLPGWAFTIEDAVVDMSSKSTPFNVQFPKKYVHPDVDATYLNGKTSPKWKGLYLGLARVKLPPQFFGNNGKKSTDWQSANVSSGTTRSGTTIGQRNQNQDGTFTTTRPSEGTVRNDSITIGAGRTSTAATGTTEQLGTRDTSRLTTIAVEGLIVDDTGISGGIFATQVVTLDKGSAGSWPLSIDSVDIRIVSNTFRSAHMSGKILMPAFVDTLGYSATFAPTGTSVFAVKMVDALKMDAMVAKVTLAKNTEIGIKYRAKDQNVSAFAKLYGNATFGPSIGGNSKSGGAAGAGSTPGGGGNKLSIPIIKFENFHLASRAPYIENVGTWGIASEGGNYPESTGFPITLHQVGMVQNQLQNEIAFGLDLSVNLVKTEDQGFGARGKVFIICDVAVDSVTNRQEWKFKRVRFDRLSIDYAGAGFKFKGFIETFENNTLYGNGFHGGIQAEFKPTISVGVVAMFGKKDDFRYFFADALVAFSPGIALGQSGMALYGFGGGISYHMDRRGFSGIKLPKSSASAVSKDPPKEEDPEDQIIPSYLFDEGDQDDIANALKDGDPTKKIPDPVPLPSELGTSLTGVKYVPDVTAGIGLKATVAFGAVLRETFNGDVTFELLFNANGGLRKLGLLGNLNFMTPPTPDAKPSVSAYFDMVYDFNQNAFDAYLRLQVDAAKGLIRGPYVNNVAGEGRIHADADDWYVYLGEPDNRIKLAFDISALAGIGQEDTKETPKEETVPLDSTKAKKPLGTLGADIGLVLNAYLDAGSILPPFPDPPPKVGQLFSRQGLDLSLANREDPSFADAGGFLFGAGFDLSMPNLKFLIFYASLEGTMGFDLMMKNYGELARCAGSEEDGPPGFNGWYAQGQMYAHIYGAVGLDIEILGVSGRFEAFTVEAGAILQAKMPSPFWFKGAIAGSYSVLGGLVSGECNFEFEAGEPCDLAPASDQGMQIVESFTPEADETEVSVFARPRATFNVPMGQEIPVRKEDGSLWEIKPEITYFRLVDESTDAYVPGSYELSDDGLVAAFTPDDILAGNTTFRAEIKVTAANRKAGQGEFKLETFGDGSLPEQSRSATFTSGAEPTTIEDNNLVYTYPVRRQLNLHRNQHGLGYMQLKSGQDRLFLGQQGSTLDAAKWAQEVRWWQDDRMVATSAVNYDSEKNRVNFPLPGDQLLDGRISYLEIVNVPKVDDDDITAGVQRVEVDRAKEMLASAGLTGENSTTVVQRTNQATGTVEGLKTKQIYRMDFRTSTYPTFAARMNALNDTEEGSFVKIMELTEATPDGSFLSIDDFGMIFQPREAFDVYDLEGKQVDNWEVAPLIRTRVDHTVTGGNWYANDIRPNIYDRFPRTSVPGQRISWRQAGIMGTVPTGAAYFVHNGRSSSPPELKEGALSGNLATDNVPQVAIRYQFPYYTYRDHADFWNQVNNYQINNTLPGDLQEYLRWPFVYPKYGDYRVQFQYVLPGQEVEAGNWGEGYDLNYEEPAIKK